MNFRLFLFNVLPYISIFSIGVLVFIALPIELIKIHTIYETGLILYSFYLGVFLTPFLFYKLKISNFITKIFLLLLIFSMFLLISNINNVDISIFALFLIGLSKNVVITFFDSKLINGNYKLYRGLGSVGFVLLTFAFGKGILSLSDIGIFLIMLYIISFISLFYIYQQECVKEQKINNFSTRNVFKHKYLWGSVLFHRISLGIFFSFGAMRIIDYLAYSEYEFSIMWIVAVILEILVLIFFKQLLSVRNFILLSFLITSIRFLLIYIFAEYFYVLVFSQALHTFTFAIFHLNILKLINDTFKERTPINIKVYNAVAEGLGLLLGTVIGIYIANNEHFFLILAMLPIIGFILFSMSLNKEGLKV